MKELEEFGGDLSLEGLHFWKTAFSAMTHPVATIPSSQGTEASEAKEKKAELSASSVSDKKVIVLPCRNPPSRERVQLWLEARKQYDTLQREQREKAEVEQDNPERTELPEVSTCPSVNFQHHGNVSKTETRRRKKLNLSLALSPLVNTGPQSKTTEESPVSDESTVSPEEEEEEDSSKTTSPESPELPPWQESHQLSPSGIGLLSSRKPCVISPEPLSPRFSDSQERLLEDKSLSPFHGMDRDGGSSSPHLLHSTPYVRKRRRSTEDLDPVCSTPITDSKSPSGSEITAIIHTFSVSKRNGIIFKT